MMKNFFTVRKVLSLCLAASVAFAAYSMYYKIRYWGFDFRPNKGTDVWVIDAHISFKPTGAPIAVSLAVPEPDAEFKILNQDFVAKGYQISQNEQTKRFELTSKPRASKQNLYYRLTIYDNEESRGKIWDEKKITPQKPVWDELQMQQAEEILSVAESLEGNTAQKIITVFNQEPLAPSVAAFLPVHLTEQQRAEFIVDFLALKNIPARLVRGVRLEEGKKAAMPDLMLEAHDGYKWRLYDLRTGVAGLPKNFVVFQRGGVSLLDVSGGENSKIRFSVLKSVTSSLKMAGHRAEHSNYARLFDYSIYNLPLLEQNTLKWLMVFPLGILVVVLMRNVIGLATMGTFTPMLIAMSLVKTGFWSGLISFALIISIGIALRALLSRLNLLLVPRISAVVIFVILIMQCLTVIGYQLDWQIASSAVFFPIIITAWIIERASITWEEEGASNAVRQIVYSLLTAVATYFVISSEDIRHIMFAFNELNLVILFVVMLLGTYTGYRLTELKRFAPLVKE
jgi:hypothetical protein